jgi:hypothetical protein
MRWLWFGVLAGCGGGVGSVEIGGWGEDGAIDGFRPADLADGWDVTFDHWVTSVGAITLSDPGTGDVVFLEESVYLVDWSLAPDPVVLSTAEVAEGRYDLGFSFVAPSASATPVNGAPADAVAAMTANGWNTWVQGAATRDGVTVTFSWGMANPRRYGPCTNGADASQGVAVSAGESAEATVFVHTDHLLWDTLATEEASLRFAPIAAWADANGDVPLDDLAGSPTASLVGRDGSAVTDEQGSPLSYDDAGLGLSNLRDFIVYSTAQQAHLNGEGECPSATP